MVLARVHRQAALPALRSVPRANGGVLGFFGGATGKPSKHTPKTSSKNHFASRFIFKKPDARD